MLAAVLATAPQAPEEICSQRFDVRIRLLGKPAVGARVKVQVDVRSKVPGSHDAIVSISVPKGDARTIGFDDPSGAVFRTRIRQKRTRFTVPIEILEPMRGYVFVVVNGMVGERARRNLEAQRKRWFAYRYLHLDVGPQGGRWGLGALEGDGANGRSDCQLALATEPAPSSTWRPEEEKLPRHQECPPCGIPMPSHCTPVAWHGDPCDSGRCTSFVCEADPNAGLISPGLIPLSR